MKQGGSPSRLLRSSFPPQSQGTLSGPGLPMFEALSRGPLSESSPPSVVSLPPSQLVDIAILLPSSSP
ncbi:UNVERIFIED_CONTAM: hypothetical protein Sangu_1968900 [Sesamum angustifolium]|uniref:Uncharacterized protein n=1 Tax=Sesamum angustifolium TaxID=2727405 RepID=A0AAW2LZ45_9LAMI